MTNAALGWTAMAITNLMTILLFSLQPYYGARSFLFGVYVPQEYRADAQVRQLRVRFAAAVWVAAVAIAAVGAGMAGIFDEGAEWIITVIFILQVVVVGFVFGRYRKQALRLKNTQRWASPDTGKRAASIGTDRKERTIGYRWYAAQLLVVAATIGIAIALWDRIPDTIATHYGMGGEADTFSRKTVSTVFGINFIQLFLIALFLFINWSIRVSKQSLDPADPKKSLQKQLKISRLSSIVLWALSLAIIIFFSVVQGFMLYNWPQVWLNVLLVALPLLLIGSISGLMIYMAKKGCDEQPDFSLQDDRYWRVGGLFYYNRHDPALFVPKRVGIGWTFNMAHPIEWIISAAIVLVPIGIAVIVSVTGG